MKIKKRDGVIVDFYPNKIETSIYNCAADINFTLTEGDIKLILKSTLDVLDKLDRTNSYTSSYEVKGIVFKVLQNQGFKTIAKEYISR